MRSQVRCRVWLIVLLASILLGTFNVRADTVVTETSLAGQNVTAASKFLRSMGFVDKANNILEWLRAGKIYSAEKVSKGNAETGPLSGDITVENGNIIGVTPNKRTEPKPFDADKNFREIVNLARILFHEKVHAHQSYAYHVWSTYTPGKEPEEYDAWTDTLFAMDSWISSLSEKYKISYNAAKTNPAKYEHQRIEELRKFKIVVDDKSGTLSEFINNNGFGYDLTAWKKLREKVNALQNALTRQEEDPVKIGMLVKEIAEAEGPPSPGGTPQASLRAAGEAAGEAVGALFNVGNVRVSSATLTVDPAHFTPNVGAKGDQWGVAGSGLFPIYDKLGIDLNAGYHRVTTSGPGPGLNNWTAGASLVWQEPDWRFGPSFGFQSNSVGFLSTQTYNYGPYVDWFALPYLTLSTKGGGFSSTPVLGGFYFSGGIKLYATPNFVYNSAIDYTRFTSFASSSETDFTISAEYLFSERTPISFFGGFTRNQFSPGNFRVNTVSFGLKLYLNGDGAATLVDRQRTGTLGT